jgi:hypothetical protein
VPSVSVILTLPSLALISLPLILTSPETISSSSIVTVPPAESIVRLPEEVSISLSPVTPI